MIQKVSKATGVKGNELLQDQSDYFNKICCIKDFSFKDFFSDLSWVLRERRGVLSTDKMVSSKQTRRS